MPIRNEKDAAWQEIKSVGIFSSILALSSELTSKFEIQSKALMITLAIIIIIGNLIWAYWDAGEMEDLTTKKQSSRIGVNVTICLVVFSLYGLSLLWFGVTDGTDVQNQLKRLGVDSEWIKATMVFLASAIIYSLVRLSFNFLLLVVAFFKELLHL